MRLLLCFFLVLAFFPLCFGQIPSTTVEFNTLQQTLPFAVLWTCDSASTAPSLGAWQADLVVARSCYANFGNFDNVDLYASLQMPSSFAGNVNFTFADSGMASQYSLSNVAQVSNSSNGHWKLFTQTSTTPGVIASSSVTAATAPLNPGVNTFWMWYSSSAHTITFFCGVTVAIASFNPIGTISLFIESSGAPLTLTAVQIGSMSPVINNVYNSIAVPNAFTLNGQNFQTAPFAYLPWQCQLTNPVHAAPVAANVTVYGSSCVTPSICPYGSNCYLYFEAPAAVASTTLQVLFLDDASSSATTVASLSFVDPVWKLAQPAFQTNDPISIFPSPFWVLYFAATQSVFLYNGTTPQSPPLLADHAITLGSSSINVMFATFSSIVTLQYAQMGTFSGSPCAFTSLGSLGLVQSTTSAAAPAIGADYVFCFSPACNQVRSATTCTGYNCLLQFQLRPAAANASSVGLFAGYGGSFIGLTLYAVSSGSSQINLVSAYQFPGPVIVPINALYAATTVFSVLYTNATSGPTYSIFAGSNFVLGYTPSASLGPLDASNIFPKFAYIWQPTPRLPSSNLTDGVYNMNLTSGALPGNLGCVFAPTVIAEAPPTPSPPTTAPAPTTAAPTTTGAVAASNSFSFTSFGTSSVNAAGGFFLILIIVVGLFLLFMLCVCCRKKGLPYTQMQADL